MTDGGVVRGVAQYELVAALYDHRAAVLVARAVPLLQRQRRRLFADEGNRAVATRHVEHLVPRPAGGVGRNLCKELRRRQRAFVHDVENDARDVVVGARAVGISATEADRLVPVVGNRTPLPQEVLELFAELRLACATGGNVGIVVRREEHVELRERTALYAVEVFAVEEVQPHEHHHVVGRHGRARPQPLQAVHLSGETHRPGVRGEVLFPLRYEAVYTGEHRIHRDCARIVERIALDGALPEALLHAGESKRQDCAPVRDGVVEVLPHVPGAVGIAAPPFIAHARRDFRGVHFAGAAAYHAAYRPVPAIPDGDRREPVERRDVYRHPLRLRGEALRLRDAPRLAGRTA